MGLGRKSPTEALMWSQKTPLLATPSKYFGACMILWWVNANMDNDCVQKFLQAATKLCKTITNNCYTYMYMYIATPTPTLTACKSKSVKFPFTLTAIQLSKNNPLSIFSTFKDIPEMRTLLWLAILQCPRRNLHMARAHTKSMLTDTHTCTHKCHTSYTHQ